jgi:hypothetical protein
VSVQFPPSQPWQRGQNQPPWQNAPQPRTGQPQPLPPGNQHQPPWPGGQRPPEPRNQHRTRNAIIAIVGSLVILGGIGALVGGNKTPSSSTSPASVSSSPTTSSSPVAKASPATVSYTTAQRRFIRDVDRYVPALGAVGSQLVIIGNAICNLRRTGISQRETIAEQTFPNLTRISQQARLVRGSSATTECTACQEAALGHAPTTTAKARPSLRDDLGPLRDGRPGRRWA